VPRAFTLPTACTFYEGAPPQRRACGLVRIDPKTYRYRRRRDDDSVLRTRLKELAAQRRRFGYRRLHLLIARDGVTVNHKKLYRIYREEKLVVRKRGGRKRARHTGADGDPAGAGTSVGRSTSCRTLFAMAAASGYLRSWTTSHASA
jgi:transposase InsO family protein